MFDTSHAAESDERGAFTFTGLEPGAWDLRLYSLSNLQLCPPDPGRTVTVPASGVGRGHDRVERSVVVFGAGKPLASATVRVAVGADAITATTDADGRMR